MSAKQNKAIVRRYFAKVQNERTYSVLDEIFTATWDLPGYKQFLAGFHGAFPDYQVAIEDQIAEGDKVVTRWTARAHHLGTWMSPLGIVPASGKSVTLTGITIDRVENHRIAERWFQPDSLGMLQQLGLLPSLQTE